MSGRWPDEMAEAYDIGEELYRTRAAPELELADFDDDELAAFESGVIRWLAAVLGLSARVSAERNRRLSDPR